MSRSYKKHPFCKDWNRRKRVGKQIANSKVRTYLKQGKEIPNGKAYRKIFETWDIYDYHWRETKQESLQYYNNHPDRYENEQDAINTWAKMYYRK